MNDTLPGSSSAARSALADDPEAEQGWFRQMLRRLMASRRTPPQDPADHTNAARRSAALEHLRAIPVEEVAVPRAEVVAVPVDIGLPELVEVFRRSGYTRLPVYEDTLDSPLGMIHLKDLALRYGFGGNKARVDLKSLIRPVLFVPPSMPVSVLLQKMRTERTHMALVIDEYGGVDGLVTIEDLIETVIGEIEDEHDQEEAALWTQEKPGVFLAKATAPLDEFAQATGLPIADDEIEDEVDTLGGLVFVLTGRVPGRGEVIAHPSGAEFEVVDADPRRIKRLRVRLPEARAA